MAKSTYDRFVEYLRELANINRSIGLLEWDQETYMPPGSVENRASMVSTLTGIYHKKLTSRRLGRMLEELQRPHVWEGLDDYQRANVRETQRAYEKETKLPANLVRNIAKAKSRGFDAWVKARKKSDFSAFAPALRTLVKLKMKVAECYGYEHHPYDALIDDYEPYTTTKDISPVFEALERKLAPIVDKVINAQYAPRYDILQRRYSIKKQERFVRAVITDMGFDWNIGRLDVSAHPFTMGMGMDIRITTRYMRDYLPSALFGTIHEAGHALYEMGFLPEHQGTPMAEAVSLGYHESQSRLWENLVGRGQSFWRHYFPMLKRTFSKRLEDVSLEDFYGAVNHVQPSLIRVEADELTYNLHILLRYNIEMMLFNSEVDVKDLPSVWNEFMDRYLHIVPESDANGVLQDIHWSQGYFGYFPTYTLGNLYAAQIFRQARKDIEDLDERIAGGDLITLKRWLNTNVHQYGKMYTAEDLTKRITGEGLNPEHFLAYIRTKFGGISRINL